MTTPALHALAADLAAAHRDTSLRIPAARLAALTAREAMWLQGEMLRLTGEGVPAVKVGMHPSGIALAAPIPASLYVLGGGDLTLPRRGILGLEIEVAAELARDVTPEMAEAGEDAVLAAVARFHVGFEIISTRIDDRAAAGDFGPVADNMITGGYVLGAEVPRDLALAIAGAAVTASVDGRPFLADPAVHPFGGVLKPIRAYAVAPFDHFGGLSAGMVVTTGSLCRLVTVAGPCEVAAQISGRYGVKVRLV